MRQLVNTQTVTLSKTEIIAQHTDNMNKITVILGVLLTTSCGTFSKMTEQEKELNYKIDKLDLEYQYKKDSLLIEFYRNQPQSILPQDEYEGLAINCENCDEID